MMTEKKEEATKVVAEPQVSKPIEAEPPIKDADIDWKEAFYEADAAYQSLLSDHREFVRRNLSVLYQFDKAVSGMVVGYERLLAKVRSQIFNLEAACGETDDGAQ